MPLLFCQHRVATSLMFFSPGPNAGIRLALARTLTYTVSSGTPPGPDTIPPIDAVQAAAPGQTAGLATFSSATPWLIMTFAGSLKLYLLLAAHRNDLDTLFPGTSYAILCKVAASEISDWQQT